MTILVTTDLFATKFLVSGGDITVTSNGSITDDIAISGVGKNTVRIYGFVAGTNGIVLSEPVGSAQPVGFDTVLIAPGGSVQATTGIHAKGYGYVLSNAGSIAGDVGIRAGGEGSINNTGRIDALVLGVRVDQGNLTVFNSGVIDSSAGHTSDIIAGLGEARGAIVGEGSVKVDNTGLVRVTGVDAYGIAVDGGWVTITNSGEIDAGQNTAIFGEGGWVTNEKNGTIEGKTAIDFGAGSGRVANDGHISGDIHLGLDGGDYEGIDGTISGTVFGSPYDASWFYGGAGQEHFVGGGDMDYFDGGGGADIMAGGAGGDFYYVDNIKDQVIDKAGNEGYDQLFTSVTYRLAADAEIENFATQSTAAIDLTGNEFAQFVVGNKSDNRLDGGGSGKGGSTIDHDIIVGGEGNDTYLISSASDEIGELPGGIDRVMARVSFALPTLEGEFEILTTNGGSGTAAINLTGNQFVQEIVGNYGANRLEGKGGPTA